MSRVASVPPGVSPSPSLSDFRSSLERALGEVAEAHARELEILRRSLYSGLSQPSPYASTSVEDGALRRGGGSISLELQEAGGEVPYPFIDEVDPSKSLGTRELFAAAVDPSKSPSTRLGSGGNHFDNILPGTPVPDEDATSTPLRCKSDCDWRRTRTGRVGSKTASSPRKPNSGSGAPMDERVSPNKALREADELGLLSTSLKKLDSVHTPQVDKVSTFERSTTLRWQWMHRTGWRDYKREETMELEKTFQGGESKARLKSGKQGQHPMEIFFADMLQHDVASRKVRSVRRLGPDPWWQRLRRFCMSYFRAWEAGRPRMESFERYYTSNDVHHRRISRLDDQGITIEPLQNEDGPEMERRRRRASGCKRLADSNGFIWFTVAMIVMNAIWIAIETDHNEADNLLDADLIFQVVENFFCVVFTGEMTIRFLSFVSKSDALFDTMFVFDFLCTVSMVVEVWLIPFSSLLWQGGQGTANTSFGGLFRLARLLRVTRIGRLVRIVPDFVTLLKGLYRSLKPVMVSTFLLSTIILLFAIVFRSWVRGTRLGQCCLDDPHCEMCDGYFHSIPETVLTLLFNGTFVDSVKKVVNELKVESVFLTMVFTLYIFITNCAMLNMLIGIICGVVAEVKVTEKERSDKNHMMSRLSDIMAVYDGDGTKSLKKDEFDLFISNPEVKHVLTEFQVDVWGMRTFMDVYAASIAEDNLEEFGEDPVFPFDEILDIVLRLRGGGGASVSDIVNLRRFTGQRLDNVESIVHQLSLKQAASDLERLAGAHRASL